MKSSKSSTSLAFESRLSKLKRASSEDTLNKPGAAAASGAAARLKKTSTSGAISELTESRLRGPSGDTIPGPQAKPAFPPQSEPAFWKRYPNS
ncbi:hypothetical protein MJG53_015137 [Ovis ammon polii x Ovis aries]|uniref:Uncharacterized protein n=2 Tax=Ovis TaxID=9935 RepID=A0AAD4Y0Q2_OVIAM|nr:hypothetical protein MG293_016384 [Ovis ammon polii]KAI4556184.1 hypothetical protein MJT46_014807 [Ovis ammon polii x Ovis aries]KAI4566460.1 hypothetical protein MJG53_015137 [Ovis ammon polii x Ovis aries]